MTSENIETAFPADAPTVFSPNLVEAGKGGKGGEAGEAGVFEITNTAFIEAVFPKILEGAFAAVCLFKGNPENRKDWSCQRADLIAENLMPEDNNYINAATFYPGDDGTFKARKAQFSACHFLMLDDLELISQPPVSES